MFAAIDAGDTARATALDGDEVDPTFDEIQTSIFAAADERRASATRHLNALSNLPIRVVIATPIVFALGLGLVIFFWTVLRSYQAQAKAAVTHEAAAMRHNEQRFRLLIQNTSDVVLICGRAGAVAYQSPAAQTAWGYGGTELLAQKLIALSHPPTSRPRMICGNRCWKGRQSRGTPNCGCATATVRGATSRSS